MFSPLGFLFIAIPFLGSLHILRTNPDTFFQSFFWRCKSTGDTVPRPQTAARRPLASSLFALLSTSLPDVKGDIEVRHTGSEIFFRGPPQ